MVSHAGHQMHRQYHRSRDKETHEFSLEITGIITPRRHSVAKRVKQNIGFGHVRRLNINVFLKNGKLLTVVRYVSAVWQGTFRQNMSKKSPVWPEWMQRTAPQITASTVRK